MKWNSLKICYILMLSVCSATIFAEPSVSIAKTRHLIQQHPELPLRALFKSVAMAYGNGKVANGGFISPRHFVTVEHFTRGAECKQIELRTFAKGRLSYGERMSKMPQGRRHVCQNILVEDEELDVAVIEVLPISEHFLEIDANRLSEKESYFTLSHLAVGYASFVEGVALAVPLGTVDAPGIPARVGTDPDCDGKTCPNPNLNFARPLAEGGTSSCSAAGSCSSSVKCGVDSGCGSLKSNRYGAYFDGFAESGVSGSTLVRLVKGTFCFSGVLTAMLEEQVVTEKNETLVLAPEDYDRVPVHYQGIHNFLKRYPEIKDLIETSIADWEEHKS